VIQHTGGMEDAHVRACLQDQLTALGPFFAADTHAPHTAPTAPWQSMADLIDDPAILADRLQSARASLAASSGQGLEAVELRVAASVTHLGLAARVLSPLLALAVLHGRTAPVSLRDLRWQPTAPGVFPLSIADLDNADAVPGTGPSADTNPDKRVDAFAQDTVRTIADELCAATRPFGVSEHVLRGNITSALAGTCAALGAALPDQRPRSQAAFSRLRSHPVLAGTSQTSLDGRFQRRSCCLIYRAAPDRNGMVCGDCVLLGARRRAG